MKLSEIEKALIWANNPPCKLNRKLDDKKVHLEFWCNGELIKKGILPFDTKLGENINKSLVELYKQYG